VAKKFRVGAHRTAWNAVSQPVALALDAIFARVEGLQLLTKLDLESKTACK
jgi:hypothetical protein